MRKRITTEEAKNIFYENNYIPLFDKCINKEDKLLAKTKDGYKVLTSPYQLNKGTKPLIFSKSNPYTIENINLYCKVNKKPYKLLSNNYVNSKQNLKWKCLNDNCNNEFNSCWNDMYHNNLHHYGCNECTFKVQGELQSASIEDVKKRVLKNNSNIRVLELYTKELANGKRYKIAKCHCSIHDVIWEVHLTNLLQNRQKGCRICGNEQLDGFYGETIAERNKEIWIKESATLYCIECWNQKEHFYKIGVTTLSIKQRFNSKEIPYNYNILKQVKMNKYNAIYLEKELHNMNKEYKYIPKIHFGGYTECFFNLNFESIENKIEEILIN